MESKDYFSGITKSFSRHGASYRDFASYIVLEHTITAAHTSDPDIPPLTFDASLQVSEEPIGKIGIVGAGASGLYAALILESLDIDYEILEANKRIGGRIFTHRFNDDIGKYAPVNTPARYDYFDVGAMRFPRISFMNRVFDLFKVIGIDDLQVSFQLSAPNNLHYYNTRPPFNPTINGPILEKDYFHVSTGNKGTVSKEHVEKGPDYWITATFEYFINLFKKIDQVPRNRKERQEAFETAWSELMKQDHNSVRGYMLAGSESKPSGTLPPLPGPVVEWLETFSSATGEFDLAFTESVLYSLDFSSFNVLSYPKPLPNDRPKPDDNLPEEPDSGWVCIDGGADHIIEGMLGRISQQPIAGSRVVKVEPTGTKTLRVYDASGRKREYSQVILTAPLGCISDMDLDGCDLLWNQKLAIRSLHYDPSTKFAIKFAMRWWEDPVFMKGYPIKGGASYTDIPIRICVYPSYGMHCPPDAPAPGVLLASYTWGQDARRLGSLTQGKDTESEKLLLDLVLENICKLHDIPRGTLPPVIDYYAYDWSHDPYSRGAFASFGPAQFGCASPKPTPGPGSASMFAALKAPAAGGKLHFAGEATSVHHGWVLGSLNSAWRAVYNALDKHKLQDKLIQKWGIPDEETETKLRELCLLSRFGAL